MTALGWDLQVKSKDIPDAIVAQVPTILRRYRERMDDIPNTLWISSKDKDVIKHESLMVGDVKLYVIPSHRVASGFVYLERISK